MHRFKIMKYQTVKEAYSGSKQDFSPNGEPYATWRHDLEGDFEGLNTFDVTLEMRRIYLEGKGETKCLLRYREKAVLKSWICSEG